MTSLDNQTPLIVLALVFILIFVLFYIDGIKNGFIGIILFLAGCYIGSIVLKETL